MTHASLALILAHIRAAPPGVSQLEIRKAACEAVAEATRRGKLRPNSVDSLTGKNSGNNLGTETPIFHFEQWEQDEIEVKLVLKGGGCENTNTQYSVPCDLGPLGRADRTLDGVNPNPELAALEARILEEANRIGVGPMGFGGQLTLIGCKITAANRLPACFFVSVAYDCWAFRRLGVRLDAASGAVTGWLYRDPDRPVEKLAATEGFPLTGREIVLTTPVSEEAVRALKVGDVVLINGETYTGRDSVHAYLMKNPPPARPPASARNPTKPR